MFSSTSYAEWKKVLRMTNGDIFYVDFDRIKKFDGYVYYWWLNDFLKPDSWGDFSSKAYVQGDCKQFRYKVLSYSFHKEPMARGVGHSSDPPFPDWTYPKANSPAELKFRRVCDWVK